jgi:hypothetical protein
MYAQVMEPAVKRAKGSQATAQSLTGDMPAMASSVSGRQEKARFRFQKTDDAGFVELMDDSMTPDDSRLLLLKCLGVRSVEAHKKVLRSSQRAISKIRTGTSRRRNFLGLLGSSFRNPCT